LSSAGLKFKASSEGRSALGAEVVLTPAAKGTKGAKQKALELHEKTPNSFYIGQHHNFDNRRAHLETTGPELWEDTDGEIDIFVVAMGACGTICGVSEFIKPKKPSFISVGVEPREAPFLSEGEWAPHRLMGMAPGFVPKILDRSLIDIMVTVSEEEAGQTSRERR
jgi:cysteine synthase A